MQADIVTSLLTRALQAPSSHNSQPWQFAVDDAWIELWADRRRALPVNDPSGRELLISCGAALMALRVAAAVAGLAARVELLPCRADADLLARVGLSGGPADASLAWLGPGIEVRRTCRHAYDGRAPEPAVAAAIVAALAEEGAGLITVDAAQRQAVGELVAEGDHIRWRDRAWRAELAMWLHGRRDGDGLVLPALLAPLARAAVRRLDLGKRVAGHDRQGLTLAPWLTVVSSVEDSPRAWLMVGQALQRALLTACRHGVQASYLNQPVQLPVLRRRLQSLLGTQAFPQLLLCWGYPQAPLPATPRRSLDSVLRPAAGKPSRARR